MTWYDDIVRTIIDLRSEQVEGLAALCARARISRAEAIRRAVDLLLEETGVRERRRTEAVRDAFGLWEDRQVDTESYLAELRAEWER